LSSAFLNDVDKAYYDAQSATDDPGYGAWMAEIESYFRSYEAALRGRLRSPPLSVLELGAGSCGLSLCFSRWSEVKEVVCFDLSLERMKSFAGLSHRHLGGEPAKLRFEEGDFNVRLPFADGTFDVIAFDASLHHSRSIWTTLAESRRVLGDHGWLVAQRESALSPLRFRRQLRRLLSTPEARAGVSENMYLREQYSYYLAAAGFEARFLAHHRTLARKALFFLNGILFTEGTFLARKASS
jgi:ubiquinone/menaquinone biosynthesis C-methylase UbiE